jgi:uncharacterized protein (TIGR03067 family)
MKTFIVGLIVLIATSLIATEPSQQNALQRDIDGIQGTWKIVALECDGQPAPPEIVRTLKLVFKDDTLTFKPGEPGFTNYKYKLDPTVQPSGFALIHADGTNKGESENGIYSLVGDHLKICFGRGKQRPNELTARAGSGQSMYSLEREK